MAEVAEAQRSRESLIRNYRLLAKSEFTVEDALFAQNDNGGSTDLAGFLFVRG